MLGEGAARNYAEESGNQCVRWSMHVLSGRWPPLSIQLKVMWLGNHRIRIMLLCWILRVSSYFKTNYEIWTFERYIYQHIYRARERWEKRRWQYNIIVPLRLTKEKKEKHVNLLYLRDLRRDDENVIGHFTWIKNLSRLIGSQLSNSTKKKYLCDR